MENTELIVDYIDNLKIETDNKFMKEYLNYFKSKMEPLIVSFINENNLIVTEEMLFENLEERDLYTDTFEELNKGGNMISQIFYPFYTVYSDTNNKQLCIKFADILFKDPNKFKYIEIRRNSEYIYSVYTDFKVVLRIIGLRTSVYKALPTVKLGEFDLNHIDPNIYRIFIYKDYSNPHGKVQNWKRRFEQEKILNKQVPIPFVKHNKFKKAKEHQNVAKIIKSLKNDNKSIVIENLAYNLMIEYTNSKISKENVKYVVFLSLDPEAHIKKIKEMFNEKELMIKKRTSQFNLFKQKLVVSVNNKKVAEIYDSSEDCIPFTEYKGYRIGNPHVLLVYFYIGLWITYNLEEGIRNMIQRNIFKKINGLIKMRSEYLKRKNLVGVEKEAGLMKIFHLECLGDQVDYGRKYNIRKWNKEVSGFYYKPELYFAKHNKLLSEN